MFSNRSSNEENVKSADETLQSLCTIVNEASSTKVKCYSIKCDASKEKDVSNLVMLAKQKLGNVDFWIDSISVYDRLGRKLSNTPEDVAFYLSFFLYLRFQQTILQF